MRESQIEAYLAKRVKELGGEVRKVEWVGRRSAPDRLVMLPPEVSMHDCSGMAIQQEVERSCWVEVKNPETIKTFPADARERAQHREHERMRKLGQRVEVIGTIEQVDKLLS